MICPDCDGTGEDPDDGVALVCKRCEGAGELWEREEELFPMVGVTLYNKDHKLNWSGDYCIECKYSTELLLALGGKGHY